ncbi:hypothetical protein [Chroococcus sp. FPU101]|uniref:hypothetical protein n=1 Tax=Chroococcus sp. FPU101 TaxID=1974212 RepID=UPI001A9065C2|nr:hypothetical protein [Chroococcus sp. FPU101]GFE71257.1 hypothetical protein CFPU101_38670 [Chroococcus sp. FPU101]
MANFKCLQGYGVNLDDPKLLQLWQEHPERLDCAVAALDEAHTQKRVKNPTAFMKAAIRDGYKPTPSEQHLF